MLATMGLRLSQAKTRVIRWRRKRGTNTWYVYTFIDHRPIRSLKAKIRALTPRTSQQDLGTC